MFAKKGPDHRGPFAVRAAAALAVGLNILAFVGCATAAPTATPTGQATPTAPTPTALAADFGDAPDPAYPTLLASDGARTERIDQLWLGNLRTPSVSAEPDANVIDRDPLDDGIELYLPFDGATELAFRAVKGTSAAAGVAYFNLLVDLDRDGRWQGADWVVRDREVTLDSGEQAVIEIDVPALIDGSWLRAALTDAPVPTAVDGTWHGTGRFAAGEIEDYRFVFDETPPTQPPPTVTPTPTYTPTPTPTATPTATPTEAPTLASGTPGTTVTASPTFIQTGDFVVECSPAPAEVVHGESVEIGLLLTSGANTPPERFRGRVPGGEQFGGGTLGVDPAAGDDGWSAWGEGASVSFSSTHVDPPARVERSVLVLLLQSPSTTRALYCLVNVTHTEPSPSPTEARIPTLRVNPPVLTVPATGSANLDISGEGFVPGPVQVIITAPTGASGQHEGTADDQGRLQLPTFQVPHGSPVGIWRVVATDAGGAVAEATFELR
jgi:hypothetical protein